MALSKHSKFYFIDPVTDGNFYMNFSENGVDELVAEVQIGEFTPEVLADKVANALNIAGALTYTVTFDRATRKYLIQATGNFMIVAFSGSQVGRDLWPTLGFPAVDTAMATEHESVLVAGYLFEPQFILQDYIPSSQFQDAIKGVQNVSASGVVEVVSFGNQNFIEMRMLFQNSLNVGGNWPIKKSSTGLEDLISFMNFITKKYPIEFMENGSDLNTYETIMLESTEQNQNGLGYRIAEMTDRQLAGYYQSGLLKFRVIEVS